MTGIQTNDNVFIASLEIVLQESIRPTIQSEKRSTFSVLLSEVRAIMTLLRHVRIQRGGGGQGSGSPRKMTKIQGFLAILVTDPLENNKSCKRASNVLCWANIGPPAKRHHLMAFRYRADVGPLLPVIRSSLPQKKKRKKEKNIDKDEPPLTNLSGSAHVRMRI